MKRADAAHAVSALLLLRRNHFKELIFIYRLREIISLEIINSPFGEIIRHFLCLNALGYNHLIIDKKIPIFRYVSEYRDFDVLYYGIYTAVSADIF